MPRFPILLLTLLALSAVALAQPRPGAKTSFTYSGPTRIVARANGFRLEGTASDPARITSPQLSVAAPVIAFDLANNTVSQVRATGGVSLRVNTQAKAGTPKTYVESRSQSATLTAGPPRVLELQGNLSGFYQVGDGPKSTLSGQSARLNLSNYSADVQNPLIVIPPEATNRPDALGELHISAQRGQISQSSGTATFSGQAHAVASGNSPFDLSAPTFIVSRASDGTLSTLTTQGRTSVKYDLPPDAKVTGTGTLGRPTHVEVVSNGAVFDRATSKATFSGDVKGFYRLQTSSGSRDFPFSGNQAVISFNPQAASTQAGLNVEVTGASIDAPAFEF